MNSSNPAFAIPQRHSLVSQAAASITQAINDHSWGEHLPSERRLCEILQVSRPTIRTALQILKKNGLIEIRHGRRNRLLAPSKQTTARRQSHLIGLVTHIPFTHLSVGTYRIISEMRTHLAEQGFTTEVLVCQADSAQTQRRKLTDFVRQNQMICCVLMSVSKELQQWCAEHPLPTLVLGSCHPEIKLPSLDIDYRSVCRHAGGTLISKGHRRIALVVPHSGVAGDLASEEGFLESIRLNTHRDVRASIIRHNGTAQNIANKLDLAFKSSHPPTALLVAKPADVFIVIIYLLRRGLSVPDTVSLISRDYDHVFETVSPPIAHYNPQDDTFTHRLSRLMLQLLSQGYLAPEPNLIFPKYLAGGTVKQVG